MFDGQEPFPQKSLQNWLDCWPVDQLQHEQMRLKFVKIKLIINWVQ